uniref:Histone acetyltransferase n=1 Tax=Caenorhabditis tropicalis TaxID=1561998 RepID=A0A1I7UWW0_9PELO
MATPGILPSLNHEAVHRALKMARLLKCRVPKTSRFDRKHYFYADMPAGYQITQNERPIAREGIFGFWVFDEHLDKAYWKEVTILQLQLEQDSGKTIHLPSSPQTGPPKSLIDYNRAGCALIEIVTSPCFETAIEAIRFVQTLRLLLIHHNLCDGELHKGHLRVDANVSLSKDGEYGTRTEIKNMNSIRTIHTAINYEIARQFEILTSGGTVSNETRAADSEGRTVSMRDKEEETDYRFMVEPNLPMLRIKDEWMKKAWEEVEERGKPDFEWLRDDIGFDARSAVHIAEQPELLSFVKRCIRYKEADVTAQDILYWMRELKTIMQRSTSNYPPQRQKRSPMKDEKDTVI